VQSGAIGLLVDVVRHQGDCWAHTLKVLAHYFERVRAGQREFSEETARDVIGEEFPAQAQQLGRRTGQMHCALASTRHRSDFAPEPFTQMDQVALCRSVQDSASDSLRQLRAHEARLPAEMREDIAEEVIPAGDKFAVEVGHYSWQGTSKASKQPRGASGRYMVLWRKDADGVWRLHRDIGTDYALIATGVGAALIALIYLILI
jgi:hypothetical protein